MAGYRARYDADGQGGEHLVRRVYVRFAAPMIRSHSTLADVCHRFAQRVKTGNDVAPLEVNHFIFTLKIIHRNLRQFRPRAGYCI